jgi:SsrA-binding protein
MAAKADDGRRVIADNRKARYNFEIEETLEAGLQLLGSEVKSLRLGHANIAESYASAEDGDIKLINAYIPEYTKASHFNHEPRRPRKLLLHRREIHKLTVGVQREGMTLVPLQLYFNARGIAKLRLALAKGRKLHDKRDVSRARDWAREKGRLLRDKG